MTSAEAVAQRFPSARELYRKYLGLLGVHPGLARRGALSLESLDRERVAQCKALFAELKLRSNKNGFLTRKLGLKKSARVFKMMFETDPSALI